jgi:hypothetical protein
MWLVIGSFLSKVLSIIMGLAELGICCLLFLLYLFAFLLRYYEYRLLVEYVINS